MRRAQSGKTCARNRFNYTHTRRQLAGARLTLEARVFLARATGYDHCRALAVAVAALSFGERRNEKKENREYEDEKRRVGGWVD